MKKYLIIYYSVNNILEWYRLKKVIFQFHCYHIPNVSDKNWETTVFLGENSYLNSHQLFEIFKKENYEK